MRFVFLFLCLWIPKVGYAEMPYRVSKQVAYNRNATTLRTQVTQPSSPFSFELELRPSFPAKSSSVYGENAAEISLKASPNILLGYAQEFTNNFQNGNPQLEDGAQLMLADGYAKVSINNIWQSSHSSFGLQPRLYFPTKQDKRENGMVTATRLYFNFQHKFSQITALKLSWLPIAHIYNRSGYQDTRGVFHSNPVFEHRIYAGPELSLGAARFGLPLRFYSTRYAAFRVDANRNDSWENFLTLHPELVFALSPNIGLGAGYETGSLLSRDFQTINATEGFLSGIAQIILRLSL
jgi:hypothetical protein